MKWIHLSVTGSTQDEARLRCREGEGVTAEQQHAGRGQRGHTWSSAPGENVLASVVFEPRFLAVSEQFLLSKCVAVALCDLLAGEGIDARIKWTNDIYVGDRKIVGTLIENALEEGNYARAIVGMGLNVNQTTFDPLLPNPTSMRLETGRTFECRRLVEALGRCLDARYAALAAGGREAIERTYHERLYRLGCEATYYTPQGEPFRATIRGVRATGELEVSLAGGGECAYRFREIEFSRRVLKK